uniref:Uncharacterized protein n=1 Tax=Cannabis sativa TaxID=3483 RepID=A0A803Q598_CANSA
MFQSFLQMMSQSLNSSQNDADDDIVTSDVSDLTVLDATNDANTSNITDVVNCSDDADTTRAAIWGVDIANVATQHGQYTSQMMPTPHGPQTSQMMTSS